MQVISGVWILSPDRRHSCRRVKLFSVIKLSSIHCFIIFICVWRVACPSRRGQRYWGSPYTTLSSALRTGLSLNLELIHIGQPVNLSYSRLHPLNAAVTDVCRTTPRFEAGVGTQTPALALHSDLAQ